MTVESVGSIARKTLSTFGYATPAEATWTCDTCGVVQPRLITSINRYMKSSCACRITELERERLAEQQRQRKAQEVKLRRAVYGWLGSRWSSESLASKTFANFEVLRQPEAFQTTLAFADVMEGTLILSSPAFGTGKTHLLAALCQEMSRREKCCLFTTAPKLFQAIQYYIGQNQDYTHLIQDAVRTPLLVIDDIDKAKWSEFREEVYFEIIDSRVNAGRPIALSTNKLDNLASYVGGACCSRLSIGQIAVEMVGKDYRLEM
jgi:DNA replication protein DnaC